MTPRHHKSAAARHPDIQHLSYQPEGLYPLDLEIFRVSDLRQRVGGEALASTYRYAFPTLIFVTQGTCLHLVDFEHVRQFELIQKIQRVEGVVDRVGMQVVQIKQQAASRLVTDEVQPTGQAHLDRARQRAGYVLE